MTFAKELNYGAVLQAYALQEKLASYGEVNILNYDMKKSSFLKAGLKQKIYLALTFIKTKKKERKFRQFFDKHYRFSAKVDYLSQVSELAKHYDHLFVGSDQVWNKDITKTDSDLFFLNFETGPAKKNSYAASAGKSNLNQEDLESIKMALQNYNKISVRESSLKDALGNKQIDVVIDPTLLLTQNEWCEKLQLENNPGEYILVYDLQRNQKLISAVNDLTKETGLPIVHFGYFNRYEGKTKSAATASPKEFLSLILNAKYVVSNSFHATVFSLIFEKQFVSILSKSRGVRQVDLLKSVGLEDHILEDQDILALLEQSIDYDQVRRIVKKNREHSLSFIEKVVKEEFK
ncbi:MAG: polysaccharide pyruvyl transferase family protein [Lachnospiraceae bacterium]